MRRPPPCKQPSAGLVIHIASTFGLVYAILLGLLTVALEQTHREVPRIDALLTTLAARVSERPTLASISPDFKRRQRDLSSRVPIKTRPSVR
jgi:hypothetical protein